MLLGAARRQCIFRLKPSVCVNYNSLQNHFHKYFYYILLTLCIGSIYSLKAQPYVFQQKTAVFMLNLELR